jgi:predicted GIY-YIG superfamily endonuclease
MSFVYILHFDRPLAHAQHYTGATDDLEGRIKAHRSGSNGGRLPQVFRELGVSFVVGRVEEYDDHDVAFRRERQIKRVAHGPRYCQVCSPASTRQPAGGRLWKAEQVAAL